jgi:hypothetical protein
MNVRRLFALTLALAVPTAAAAQVSSSTPVLDYGLPFLLTTKEQPPAELVLAGLGSLTHSFDMSQRPVQLEILGTSAGTAMAQFALDGRRTPSTARMILLQ